MPRACVGRSCDCAWTCSCFRRAQNAAKPPSGRRRRLRRAHGCRFSRYVATSRSSTRRRVYEYTLSGRRDELCKKAFIECWFFPFDVSRFDLFPDHRLLSMCRGRRAGFDRLRDGTRRPLRARMGAQARRRTTAGRRRCATRTPGKSLIRYDLSMRISWKNSHKSSEAAWLPEAASTRMRREETAVSAGALRADEDES